MMKVLLEFALLFVAFSLSLAQDNDGRIVNGQEADVRDFPHVLALYDQGRYVRHTMQKLFKASV